MIRHQPHEEYHSSDDSGAGMLVASAVCAVIGGLLWALLFLAIRWVLRLPPDELLRLVATLGGVVALFAGVGIVAGALARMELAVRPSPDRSRERRPEGAAVRRGALEAAAALPPGSALVAPTAPPPAGGRAL